MGATGAKRVAGAAERGHDDFDSVVSVRPPSIGGEGSVQLEPPANESRCLDDADVPVIVDLSRSVVVTDDEPHGLTVREFDLLRILIDASGSVCARDDLSALLWPASSRPTPRAIDMLVRRTREKLGPGAEIIQSVRGRGYRYVANPHVRVIATT